MPVCSRCWGLFNANIIHQVMQSGFNHIHLRKNTKLPNLKMLVAGPTANVVLNVMEQGIHAIQFALNCLTVVLVLGRMNVFGDFQ